MSLYYDITEHNMWVFDTEKNFGFNWKIYPTENVKIISNPVHLILFREVDVGYACPLLKREYVRLNIT